MAEEEQTFEEKQTEFKKQVFANFRTTYTAGVADFYKILMAIPNLDADAKQVITFTMRQVTNGLNKEFDKKISETFEAQHGDR